MWRLSSCRFSIRFRVVVVHWLHLYTGCIPTSVPDRTGCPLAAARLDVLHRQRRAQSLPAGVLAGIGGIGIGILTGVVGIGIGGIGIELRVFPPGYWQVADPHRVVGAVEVLCMRIYSLFCIVLESWILNTTCPI
jgi:hypothetical protein